MGLSLTEKRGHGHSTRSREKGKECDGSLAQVGETMGFKVASLRSGRAGVAMGHESLPGSHGEKRARMSLVQQLELSSLSRSGSLRRMISGSEMDLPCSRVYPGIQEDQQWNR